VLAVLTIKKHLPKKRKYGINIIFDKKFFFEMGITNMIPHFILIIENEEQRSFAQTLYEMYREKMYRVAYKILYNEHDSEDAVSESFVKLIKNIDKYSDKDCSILSGLLIIIVKNTAYDISRRKRTVLEYNENIDYDREDNPEEDIFSRVHSNELYSKLHEAIKKLDDKYKHVVICKMYHKLSDTEIDDIMNISPANVRVRFHRAKQILRKHLKGDEINEK